MKNRNVTFLAVFLFLFACALFYLYFPFGFFAGIVPVPTGGRLPLETIKLPEGFAIEAYAYPVPGARSLTRGPQGTVYVGTRVEGKVYALIDADNDGRAERIETVASGLDTPNGVAYMNGSLYVAEIRRVLRFDDVDLSPPNASYAVVYAGYPGDALHGWKFIAIGPDEKLYVPVGSPCNLCEHSSPYASITRINLDGSGYEVFATGIRNTVGFDWDPATNQMWFTDNGRDLLGEDIPPDELNHAPAPGKSYGYPYCFGNNRPDPQYDKNCSGYEPSQLDLGAHVAALGMRFYNGTAYPGKYLGGVFIAEHGSWNRRVPVGYRIVYVPFTDKEPGDYEIFAEGWLGNGISWGRPVDVLQIWDGSLLVSDDKAGAVYRITYKEA